MNKETFLAELRTALAGLPQKDVEERLAFYGEMIDDRVEEGLTEAQAVEEIGPIEDIVSQTVEEIPLTKLVKETITPKRTLRGWEIALLVLGFPLWFPLLIAAAAVVFSLYVVIWALVISLWAVDVALWGSAVGCVAAGVFQMIHGSVLPGVAQIGAGLLCAGLASFLIFGCLAASKGAVRLAKALGRGIKRLFIRKESVR
ncbi:MAG: DUF1700 domain-containing protein [Oscillospiraceae bacterium]|nr:DUF1700 domain-containing protein [Oscillospiraceae bacterium]